MGFMKSISGTFQNSDIVAGWLAIAYPASTINNPLQLVVFNSAITSETETYDAVKVDDHNSTVNIGEQYRAGTWKYRLLYVNN
jgi:hypothetical protein